MLNNISEITFRARIIPKPKTNNEYPAGVITIVPKEAKQCYNIIVDYTKSIRKVNNNVKKTLII